MKLKSSNKRTYALLVGSLVVALLLLSIQEVGSKKEKYFKPPDTIQKSTLDYIQITFNQEQYDKVKKKRDKALSVGILETSDSDYVPATVTFNGQDFRAEVRLKGDWTDHLEGDKWSFRIKLKDDKTILGMRKFSIHHPKTRGYINEWLYHKAIKKEELMGLRYGFIESAVHVRLEGGNKYVTKETGLYAIEETFDKRTIESNKRKESVILKFSEAYWWNEVKKSTATGAAFNKRWNSFMNPQLNLIRHYPITTFSEEKVMADPMTRGYFELGKNLLEDLRSGNTSIENVFDVKKLAMQNAILNLFGAVHGTYSINLRFYYNPFTSKLEPIAFDGNSGLKLTKYEHFIFLNEDRDSTYLKALAYALDKVTDETYLNNLIKDHNEKISYYNEQLKTEFKGKLIHEENFRSNLNILKQEMIRFKQKFELNDIVLSSNQIVDQEEIDMPDVSKWITKDIVLTKEGTAQNNSSVYRLTRKDNQSSAYVNTNKIDTGFGNTYRVTFSVKHSDPGELFGLRMQGIYPNRSDAVFNVKTGTVAGTNSVGYLSNEKASIKDVGNGWYECTLTSQTNTDKIFIIFGPTDGSKTITGWEGQSAVASGLLIASPKIEIVDSNL